MRAYMCDHLHMIVTFLAASSLVVALPPYKRDEPACRYLPEDDEWPADEHWDRLNDTTGGRLIRGIPIAKPCYSPTFDPGSDVCINIQNGWTSSEA